MYSGSAIKSSACTVVIVCVLFIMPVTILSMVDMFGSVWKKRESVSRRRSIELDSP